jgi:hypothetical protein
MEVEARSEGDVRTRTYTVPQAMSTLFGKLLRTIWRMMNLLKLNLRRSIKY